MRPKVGQEVTYKDSNYIVQQVHYWTSTVRPIWTRYGFHDINVNHGDLSPVKCGMLGAGSMLTTRCTSTRHVPMRIA